MGEGYKFTEGPATNSQGDVFFSDVPAGNTYKVPAEGKVAIHQENNSNTSGQRFAANGDLICASGRTKKVFRITPEGKEKVISDSFKANDVTILHNGNIYVTNPDSNNKGGSYIWLLKPDGTSKVVDKGLKFSNGICTSPDQTLLFVADSRSHWVYSYQIQSDGSLKHKQRFFHLHMPDQYDDSGADGLRVDTQGRLYVATRMGIQICDQPGRVNCIIPTPNGKVSNITFGGKDYKTIYATCGDKVYKRKLKATGYLSWMKPIKPPRPGL